MTAPKDAEVFDRPLATMWFDKDRILNAVSKPVPRTLNNSKDLVRLLDHLFEGKKIYVMSDISKAGIFTWEARQYLRKELPKKYKALAMVTSSIFGKFIGNIMATFFPPSVPTKVFTNEPDARKWLKRLRDKDDLQN